MTLNKIATSAAILAAGTTTAFAGGLERSTFSSNILFEEGTYIEGVYALTNTSVSSDATPLAPGLVAPPANATDNFTTVKFGAKFDVTEKLSFAILFNGNPLGANIDYSGSTLGAAALANAAATIKSSEIDFIGKYKFTDNFSVYAGAKYQEAEATANLAILTPVSPTAAAAAIFPTEEGVGFIGGIAYERPEIGLRATLTYESEIEYTFDSVNAAGANLGPTEASSAEAYTLEFQTGISKRAPNTLLFGSVRYSKAANISVVGFELTDFDDVTTYTLGVGQRFNDHVSGSLSMFYEDNDGESSSLFEPTDGLFGVSAGLSVKVGKGVKIGGGVSWSRRGDTFSNVGPLRVNFSNNSVTTFGVKVSKTF